MESVNSFNKGMDLDTNPLNLEKGKYKEASNIRLINDVGSTSSSVNNIKGTLFDQTIPAQFTGYFLWKGRKVRETSPDGSSGI